MLLPSPKMMQSGEERVTLCGGHLLSSPFTRNPTGGYSNLLGTCCIICTFSTAHVSDDGRLQSNLIVLWAQPREELRFLSLGQVPSLRGRPVVYRDQPSA